MPDESAMAEARTCLHLGRQPGCDDCDKFARALQWQTAKRVVSDDHPQECPCIRDHLEVAFLLGMDEAAGRAETPDADEDVLWGAVRARFNPLTEYDWQIVQGEVEAIIAYRERRYREVIPVLRRAMGIIEHGAEMVGAEPYSFTKDEVIEESAKAIGIALRALSERSDG